METRNHRGIETNGAERKGDDLKKCPTATDIQAWLVPYLAELLEITTDQVEVSIPLDQYNLSSLTVIALGDDLSDWLGCELDPDLLLNSPTIESLAQSCGDMEEIIL